ncbi:MAG: fumarylacetoacetate hydrolase family protein [Bacteroidetes bacterium]|nr:fumarylacetoacetate hydrolase family protein [Bacteroidota bacterium]
MKILAIGRNYVAHIKELNNEIPADPVIFSKPETALLRNNAPFYYPGFSTDIHYEVEIVLKMCKQGKNISEKFAHIYYDEIGIGIDFTARDIQGKAKKKGLPWVIAKGFDGAAPISHFIPKSDFKDLSNINFSLSLDGEIKQKGNTKLMIYSFNYIIAYISKFITLNKGDLIFTGTPEGVGPIQIGNILVACIEDKKMLQVKIK